MLLVKKCNFFSLFVFGQKRLEIRFNDVLERKEPLFNIKTTFLNVSKIEIFQKGQPMLLVKKCQIFLYLDLVKIKLELTLNNFVEKKETFFDYKENFFKFLKMLLVKKCNDFHHLF